MLAMGFLGFGWQVERLRDRFYPPDFLGMYARLLATIVSHAQPDDVVLDAGCGSGRVFQHRQAGNVKRIVGIDVTDEQKENENLTDATKGDLRHLPYHDETFDLAIVSHVAEHLVDPEAVFAEMSRVLKPGGRYLFIEHGRAPTSGTARWQDRINPLWNRISDGCNINRKIDQIVEGANFELTSLDRFRARGPGLMAHMYRGVAARL